MKGKIEQKTLCDMCCYATITESIHFGKQVHCGIKKMYVPPDIITCNQRRNMGVDATIACYGSTPILIDIKETPKERYI